MSIFKKLTAVTSIAAAFGILAPATAGFAQPGTPANVHVPNSAHQTVQAKAALFAAGLPQIQTDYVKITDVYGNQLLKLGDMNSRVATVQDQLMRLGYYKGRVDGVFENLTFQAVKSFQSVERIKADGVVNLETKAALFKRDAQNRATLEKEKTDDQLAVKKAHQQPAEEPVFKKASTRPAAAASSVKKAAAQPVVKSPVTRDITQPASVKSAGTKAAPATAKAAAEQKPAVRKAVVKPIAEATQQTVTKSAAVSQKRAVASSPSSGLTVVATAYSLKGTTATGVDLSSNPGARVVAVDPSVIPLGSTVQIPGYGSYTAADTGSAIQGHRIDIHFSSTGAALNFGRQTLNIQISR